MADGDLLLIYRSLLTGDLYARKQKLLDQMTTITSMSVGQKSFSRDLRHLKDQLAAITFVLQERSGGPCGYKGVVVTDFSDGAGRGQPAGTNDQLSY